MPGPRNRMSNREVDGACTFRLLIQIIAADLSNEDYLTDSRNQNITAPLRRHYVYERGVILYSVKGGVGRDLG